MEKNRGQNKAYYTVRTRRSSLLFSVMQFLVGSHRLPLVVITTELLSHGQLLQRLPAALFAVRPDGRRGELPICITFKISHHPEPPCGQFTQPTIIGFGSTGTEACGLPVGKQGFQVHFARIVCPVSSSRSVSWLSKRAIQSVARFSSELGVICCVPGVMLP